MKGYQAMAAAIAQLDARTIFSLPGGGNVFIDYALVREHSLRYVTAVREDGAVAMADAYARASGRVGLASVTLGPGLTNTVTALTTAARSHTSMVLLVGEESAADAHPLQRIDQAAVVAPTGAAFHRADRPAELADDVVLAFRTARNERRPVVLVLPLDMQRAEVPEPRRIRLPAPLVPPAPTEAALDAAVGVMATARRPVVVAGAGAGGASGPILQLAERLGAPLATTLLNPGFFAGQPFNLGIMGTLSTPVADETLRHADCVVAFGASLNDFTTASGSLVEDTAVVHNDINAAALGRYTQVTAPIIGDAAVTASALTDWLDKLDLPSSRHCSPELRTALAEERGAPVEPIATGGRVDMSVFLQALDRVLPPDRAVAIDGGRFFPGPIRHLRVPDPSSLLWTLSFGSIGLGLAAGIGAACAREDRPTVVVMGDGGFMMSQSELNTAVRSQLDLVVVVLNDGSYGAEYTSLDNAGLDPEFACFDWPDLAAVGRALGATSVVVRDVDRDMATVADALKNLHGPLLIDVRCDPAHPMVDAWGT